MTGSAHASAALFGCNDYAYMLMHGAEHCILRMAECGFREFELMVHPGHLWPAEFGAAQRRALHGLFERDALELTTLNLPNIDINLASTTPEMRAYTLDLLEAIVRLAGELGARGVVLSPGKASPLLPPAPEILRGHFFAALDRLAPIAKAAGTALWIENVTVSFLPGIAAIMDTLAALWRRRYPHRLRRRQRSFHRRGLCPRPQDLPRTACAGASLRHHAPALSPRSGRRRRCAI